VISALADQISRADATGLRARLLTEAPELSRQPAPGDCDLDAPMPRRSSLITAAVLVPIIARPDPTILFTRRTSHLARHAGQVSFPGGRVHEDDNSLVETALRETNEETGITPGFITVAGFLDLYETSTGFAIVPVVGLLSSNFELLPDPNEVADVFEVPLAFLLEPRNCQRRQMKKQGHEREFYAFTYREHYIWGVTAGILVNFARRLSAE